jgi:lysine/ornithine N-monooxygenase
LKRIDGSEIEFENGEKEAFDAIILCTGYQIDLDFLHKDIRDQVFFDEEQTFLNVKFYNFEVFL